MIIDCLIKINASTQFLSCLEIFENCELAFELDHVNLMQESLGLSLFKYYCKLLCECGYMMINDQFGSNNGVLEVHLVEHKLGFL